MLMTLPLGVRWLLGVFEAGFHRGYTITSHGALQSFAKSQTYPSFSWYKRSEFGLRAAIFSSAATISGAFGGLLAVRRICAFPEYLYLLRAKGRNPEHGRGRRETGLGVDIYFGGSRDGDGRVPILLDHPGLPRQRQVSHRRRASCGRSSITD